MDNVMLEREDIMLPEIDDVMLNDDVFTIAKSNDEKQLVFGWASIARMKDGTIPFDWQGDIIPVEELESAAYFFMQNNGTSGAEHQGDGFGTVVESMIFTEEKMNALGIPLGTVHYGWWIGFHIPDKAVFDKIKDGTYNMFSIQGKAKRILI